MGVQYIRLLSGDEIIGEIESESPDYIKIARPLSMESGVDEDDPTRRYVFMSRFSPYGSISAVKIKQSAVLFTAPASPEVVRYYEASLMYCEKYTDAKFSEGITDTTEQIEETLRCESPVAATGDSVTDIADVMWKMFGFSPASNTFH